MRLTHQLGVDLGDYGVLLEERGDVLGPSPEIKTVQESRQSFALRLRDVLRRCCEQQKKEKRKKITTEKILYQGSGNRRPQRPGF